MRRQLAIILVAGALSTLLVACAGQSAAPAAEAPAAEAPAAEAPAAEAPAAEAPATGMRTFVVVPAESSAAYLVDEEFLGGALDKLGIPAGLVDVVGKTQEIEGQLQLNLNDLAAPLGENTFTVQLNTLTTDQSNRDNWIRRNGPRLNDFPLATFRATAISGAPASYTEGETVRFQMSGDLTLREITQQVTFEVSASLQGGTLTGTATTRLLMSSFGITPPNFANTLTVADEFGIEVQITAREG
ncbi:MAG: YceI family protein [Chloroflexi bacterium]|nr:YceI family protein [Chloroflexota bacterium]